MCGIAGILRILPPGATIAPEQSIPDAWLDILDESVLHRGPDGAGRFRDRAARADGATVDVALVHRRLSIIDHAGGHQPMILGGPSATLRACPRCSARGAIAVGFNGCVYNHRALRKELSALGHGFSTDHSDVEPLLHGHAEWWIELHRRLEWMGAMALWEAREARLTLARDHFGEKPLYVGHLEADTVAFASSAAAIARLVALGGVQSPALDLDPIATRAWIADGYHLVRTPHALVSAIPPAAVVAFGGVDDGTEGRWLNSRAKDWPWLRFKRRRDLSLLRSWRARSRVESLIEQAVARRLEADVPLACLLSGGVDSTVVAAMAQRTLLAAGAEPLTTVCVRMPHGAYDESEHARAVAQALGTRHVEVEVDANPGEDLVALIESIGLPFGDSSLLPTYWACRGAAEHARVVLTGDGGDELFLGYERYKAANWLLLGSVLPLGLLPRSLFRRHDPKSRSDKMARLIAAMSGRGYPDLLAIFQSRDARALMRRFEGSAAAASRMPGDVSFSASYAQQYDLFIHLPGDLLRKVDAASMLVPIEARAPLLDRTLAGQIARLSVSTLTPRRRRKGLLRKIARGLAPASAVDRPKMGFAIPIGDWFRTDFGGMRQMLRDHLESVDPFPGLLEAGVEIDSRVVARLLEEHDAASPDSPQPWNGRDHSQRLYMLLVLSVWCRWLASIRASG